MIFPIEFLYLISFIYLALPVWLIFANGKILWQKRTYKKINDKVQSFQDLNTQAGPFVRNSPRPKIDKLNAIKDLLNAS